MAVVDRFIELYDAKDVPGLVDLLVEGGSTENVGFRVTIPRQSRQSRGDSQRV